MFQRTLFFKKHWLSQQLLPVACTSMELEASSGLFGQIGLPKLIRHWQGTAVPVSHWIEHHALHFASDALLCGTYITKAFNCHQNCALKVVMQEVLIFASRLQDRANPLHSSISCASSCPTKLYMTVSSSGRPSNSSPAKSTCIEKT